MKRKIGITLVLIMAAMGIVFAGGSKESSGTIRIGVSMPTKDLQRWSQDGDNIKMLLEKSGYKVDLQYANNDIAIQASQIENMLTKNCKVIVIAAIDGSSLTEVLKTAKENGVPVIAYDRLIMNSDAVRYYATFDNYKVGQFQGTYLRDTLKLDNAKEPVYIELFTGPTDDNNVNFFFPGAMDILNPYIKKGVLVVRSGQTAKAQVATPNWSTEEAQKRMENLISAYGYGPTGAKLHAVLSSNDSVAQGIANALAAAGYTKENFPLLTGQDCDITSVKNMLKGQQSMSVFKDTRTLAGKVSEMIDALVKGSTPPINDTKTYDNGTGIIPSFLCEPVFATIDNYKKLLVESGYYTEAQLKN